MVAPDCRDDRGERGREVLAFLIIFLAKIKAKL